MQVLFDLLVLVLSLLFIMVTFNRLNFNIAATYSWYCFRRGIVAHTMVYHCNIWKLGMHPLTPFPLQYVLHCNVYRLIIMCCLSHIYRYTYVWNATFSPVEIVFYIFLLRDKNISSPPPCLLYFFYCTWKMFLRSFTSQSDEQYIVNFILWKINLLSIMQNKCVSFEF